MVRVPESVDTLVVGAGIAGLCYAHARGAGAELLVLDAAPRAGGLLRTSRAELPGAGTLRFEWGPEALQDDAPATLALLTELGLSPLAAAAASAKRFVCWRGRLVPLPLSPGAFLGTPLLSPVGKLRAPRAGPDRRRRCRSRTDPRGAAAPPRPAGAARSPPPSPAGRRRARATAR